MAPENHSEKIWRTSSESLYTSMKRSSSANKIFPFNNWVFVLILVLFQSSLSAQNTHHKKVKILPVPAIGYSPETKFYLGVVSLFTIDLYNDSLTRTSNAKLEMNYTWNKQLVVESEWNYFFKEEKWFTQGKLHFSDYPDLYYGIGFNTPDNNQLSFNSKRIIALVSVLKNMGKKWFLGPSIKYFNYSDVTAKSNTPFFPELANNSNLGFGINILKDSRNSILTPTSGVLFKMNAWQNFSAINFGELTFDFRYYQSWKNKFTWANRFLNDFTMGTPPFYDYSFLGGDKNVRGYYYGRFRDNNLSTLQSEFRFPVYKRFHMAVFGGLSNLYAFNHQVSFANTKTNYGLGIRFLVDKTENTFLRMDYAIGEGMNDGFYISFGESF